MKMNKLRMVFFAVVGVLLAAMPAFAQGAQGVADNNFSVYKYAKLAAGIGFGIAAGLAGIGQGRVAASAAEGAARNPGASGKIQILMIIGLAFIETLVIFTLLIMFVIVNAKVS
jgi:F-type H+-transporting ATPase subunit c